MHCCGSQPAHPSPGRQPSVGQPQPIGERNCCGGQVGQQSAQKPQLGPASPASPVPRTYRGRSPARINVAIPIPITTANTATFVFMDRSSFLFSLCFIGKPFRGPQRSRPRAADSGNKRYIPYCYHRTEPMAQSRVSSRRARAASFCA